MKDCKHSYVFTNLGRHYMSYLIVAACRHCGDIKEKFILL